MKDGHKIELVNSQTIGARCGYGWGETREAAIADAMARARRIDPDARFDGHRVWFAGGINC